jgi:hypothetical protein
MNVGYDEDAHTSEPIGAHEAISILSIIPCFKDTRELKTRLARRLWAGILAVLVTGALAACTRDNPAPTSPPPPTQAPNLVATPTDLIPPTITPTPLPYPWTDESAVMSGLCFESVYDAAENIFILRTPEELTGLFDLADNSQLCRRPIERGTFDFTGARVLVGLWSRGQGCSMRHDVLNVERDDVARTFIITLRPITEGECPYELVRPFWVGLDTVSDYDIRVRLN